MSCVCRNIVNNARYSYSIVGGHKIQIGWSGVAGLKGL